MTWLVNRKCFRSIFFNRNNNFIVISQICHQHKLFHENIHQQTSKKWWFWFHRNSSKFWKLKAFCFCFKFLINTQKTHGKFTRFFNQTVWLYKAKSICSYVPNNILILGKVGFQSDQITAASWSGNTCQPSNQLIITLIRLLFGFQSHFQTFKKII